MEGSREMNRLVLFLLLNSFSYSFAGVGMVKCIGEDGSMTFTQGQCPEKSTSRSNILVEESMSHHGQYRMNELVQEESRSTELSTDSLPKGAGDSNAEFYARVYGLKYMEIKKGLISDIEHSGLSDTQKRMFIAKLGSSKGDVSIRSEEHYNDLVYQLNSLKSHIRSIEVTEENEYRKISGMVGTFNGNYSTATQNPYIVNQKAEDFNSPANEYLKEMEQARQVEQKMRKEQQLRDIGAWGREGHYERALDECKNTPLANCR